MITSAFVLHLWHMVADGGNDTPSPVTSMSSWVPWGSAVLARAPLSRPSPAGAGKERAYVRVFF